MNWKKLILSSLHKYHFFLSAFLITVTLLNIGRQLYTNRSLYEERFDPDLYQQKFELSQWRDPKSTAPIGDEDFYAIAAYQYVHGQNPILINPEVPPLGKYIIGIGIELFQNQRFATLIFGAVSLISLWLLTYAVTRNILIASMAFWLMGTYSLFVDQFLHSPQLEMFQLAFLIGGLASLAQTFNTKKIIYAIFAGICLGAFVSIKVFLVHILIAVGLVGLAFLVSKTSWKEKFVLGGTTIFVALAVFTLTYTQFFILGGTPRQFLGTQKWIYGFYSGSNIDTTKVMGSYLTLIFANRWTFWSEGYPVRDYESWSLSWPVLYVASVAAVVWLFKNKKILSDAQKNLLISTNAFFIVYGVLLVFLPIYPRYLLILFLPTVINLCVFVHLFVQPQKRLR